MTLAVVLDPGHGGDDLGVTATDAAGGPQLIEKRTTLAIAHLARRALLGMGWPVAVELTRDEDEATSFATRSSLAHKYGADLVLSLHVNSSSVSTVSGAIMFTRQGDEVGRQVALSIHQAMPPELRRVTNYAFECDPDERWLDRARHVVEAFRPAPTVLVEMAHATNAGDRAEIESEVTRNGIVAALACGVARAMVLRRAAA